MNDFNNDDCNSYAYFVKTFGEPTCNKIMWLKKCKQNKRDFDLGLLIPQGLCITLEKGVVTMVKKTYI
jgi:hypothetical protein